MSTAHTEPLRPWADYRLLARLSEQTMADVYLAVARDGIGIANLVALKRYVHMSGDDALRASFLDGVRLSARLDHPNIVKVYETSSIGSDCLVAMEFLAGQTFSRVLHDRSRGLPLAARLWVLCEALKGLQYAHELHDSEGADLGVVHGNVAPNNIFITYGGQVKLLDFGIDKGLVAASDAGADWLEQSLAYMAPELARKDKADSRADVFGVGTMLWEALCGHRLTEKLSKKAVLEKVLVLQPGPLPSPTTFNPNLPKDLEAICMRALAPARDERFASVLELRREIEGALERVGELPKGADVGKVVSGLFAEERESAQALIERRWRSLEAGDIDSQTLPTLARVESDGHNMSGGDRTPPAGRALPIPPSLPPDSEAPSSDTFEITTEDVEVVEASVSQEGDVAMSDEVDGLWLPPAPDEPSPRPAAADSEQLSEPKTQEDRPAAAKDEPPVSDAAQPKAAVAGRDKQDRGPVTGAIVGCAVAGLVVALVLVALWTFSGTDPKPVTRKPSDRRASASAPIGTEGRDATAKVSKITLRIAAWPDSAQIYVDGAKVKGNPYKAAYDQDGKNHKIRAVAKGYLPVSRTVRFDANVTLELALREGDGGDAAGGSDSAEPAPSAKEAPSASAPARKKPPSTSPPKPPRPPVRPPRPPKPPSTKKPPDGDLDWSNPYAK